ncbi:MAG: hypothetical protein ACT4O5_17325 [Gammaproteobacteria bacterium]
MTPIQLAEGPLVAVAQEPRDELAVIELSDLPRAPGEHALPHTQRIHIR